MNNIITIAISVKEIIGIAITLVLGVLLCLYVIGPLMDKYWK